MKSITGLNSIHFGTSARKFVFEPYIIDDIVSKKKPKLVVVDISLGNSILKVAKAEKYLFHNSKGIAPLDISINKINMIYNYLPLDKWFNSLTRFSDIIASLTINDSFENEKKISDGGVYGYKPMTGYFMNQNNYITSFDSLYNIEPSNKIPNSWIIDKESLRELDGLIEYFGDKSDINLLLINSIKLNSKHESKMFLDSLYKVVEKYPNINILRQNSHDNKSIIKLKLKDFSSPDHLYKSGSYKLTYFLGNYINKNYNFEKTYNKIENEELLFSYGDSSAKFTVKYFELLSEKYLASEIRIVLENNGSYDVSKIATGINIYPKKEFFSKLSKKTKDKKAIAENLYMPLTRYEYIEGEYIGAITNTSKLKRGEIDYITVWLWDSEKKISTNRVKIKF